MFMSRVFGKGIILSLFSKRFKHADDYSGFRARGVWGLRLVREFMGLELRS